MPTVSAILLCRWPKRAPMVQESIASLAWQRRTGWDLAELVVVNDVAPVVAHAPWIRVVNVRRPVGVGHARNIGLGEATGDYVATGDDDDVSLPHRLDTQVALGVDAVQAAGRYVADAGLRLKTWGRGYAQATLLIARRLLQRVGGWPDATHGEDIDLLGRLVARGVAWARPRCVGYVDRRHDTNATLVQDGEDLARRVLRAGAPPPHLAIAQDELDRLLAAWRGRTFLREA